MEYIYRFVYLTRVIIHFPFNTNFDYAFTLSPWWLSG